MDLRLAGSQGHKAALGAGPIDMHLPRNFALLATAEIPKYQEEPLLNKKTQPVLKGNYQARQH